jgi:mono/diheme cytochrome c family protein
MRRHFWLGIALVMALTLAACGGGKEEAKPAADAKPEPTAEAQLAGDAAKGEEIFVPTCGACHGPEGKGVVNLGKDMTISEFIAERNDEELLAFINVGRAPDDPLNTTGVLMPPKGGNPALSDEDLLDVIAFIRTLQQ